MKKKLLAVLSMCVAVVTVINIPVQTVYAAEPESVTVDGSMLDRQATESTGQLGKQTRGQYLQSGYSLLSIAGEGLVTAEGGTQGQQLVEKIGLTIILERLDEENFKWVRIKTWIKEDTNTTSLIFSETLPVVKNYFYRVRSLHFADSDSGSSYTHGLFVD